ncbi:hypothetical protein DICVIV_13539 [Dictyocaulus viviparus]|uniref:Uncharacterized protein n=1 Tax=Dictyocaulus viviparus TaxID=29172 RepID=A0A0D8XA43_DICVI|nr:hypothetical protein DICVIV_13539 [Dictyocaulus viviparus]
MIQDRELIWRYTVSDIERNTIEQLKGQHTKFLKNHAIEVLSNARITADSERCMAGRICKIVENKEILVISTEDDISVVIPSLPDEIGNEITYNDKNSSTTFKLQDIIYIGEQTQCYNYTVTIARGEKTTKKKLKAFLYVWDPLRLPISFEELLNVLALSTEERMACVSNRRKEIFFLLHMIFTYVTIIKQPISIVETFQFHTDNFNGAPMDRCEMLCVMAFVLEWAHQTNSIPMELLKKHYEWCYTYARMSNFYMNHSNM